MDLKKVYTASDATDDDDIDDGDDELQLIVRFQYSTVQNSTVHVQYFFCGPGKKFEAWTFIEGFKLIFCKKKAVYSTVHSVIGAIIKLKTSLN